jgi:hypothetical protein
VSRVANANAVETKAVVRIPHPTSRIEVTMSVLVGIRPLPGYTRAASLGALVGVGGGATEHSHQPPDKAKPSPENQRAKALQLFLILLFGRYRSWSAESDFSTRAKSTCLPFERSHFYRLLQA